MVASTDASRTISAGGHPRRFRVRWQEQRRQGRQRRNERQRRRDGRRRQGWNERQCWRDGRRRRNGRRVRRRGQRRRSERRRRRREQAARNRRRRRNGWRIGRRRQRGRGRRRRRRGRKRRRGNRRPRRKQRGRNRRRCGGNRRQKRSRRHRWSERRRRYWRFGRQHRDGRHRRCVHDVGERDRLRSSRNASSLQRQRLRADDGPDRNHRGRHVRSLRAAFGRAGRRNDVGRAGQVQAGRHSGRRERAARVPDRQVAPTGDGAQRRRLHGHCAHRREPDAPAARSRAKDTFRGSRSPPEAPTRWNASCGESASPTPSSPATRAPAASISMKGATGRTASRPAAPSRQRPRSGPARPSSPTTT